MEETSHPITPLPPGSRIGPYVIAGQVPGGIGGMAVVYRAKLVNDPTTVALKVAHAGLGGFLKDETAFLTALKLDHPHIVEILPTPLGGGVEDYIVKDPNTGCWYFAMEYMHGGSLDDWMRRRKRLSLAQAVDVVRQVGSALDEAHRVGVVHLDVKPSNILFRQNPEKGQRHAVLTDFGIARPRGRVASGQTTLTVEYASPEQARLVQGESIDVGPTSDIYSLAVILYEMISGQLPFLAQNDVAMMHQIVYEAPSLQIPSTAPQLAFVFRRALDKEPEERYPTAKALVDDLEALPSEAYKSIVPNRRLHPVVGLGLGVLIGLGVGIPVGRYVIPPESGLDNNSPVVSTVGVEVTREVTVVAIPTNDVLDTPEAVTVTPPSVEPTEATRRPPTSTPAPTDTPRPMPTPQPTPTEAQ